MAMPLLEHSWRSPPLTFFLSEAEVPVNTNASRKAASKTNVIGERWGHAASQREQDINALRGGNEGARSIKTTGTPIDLRVDLEDYDRCFTY